MLTRDYVEKVAADRLQNDGYVSASERGSVLAQPHRHDPSEGPVVRFRLEYVRIPLPDGGEDIGIQIINEP